MIRLARILSWKLLLLWVVGGLFILAGEHLRGNVTIVRTLKGILNFFFLLQFSQFNLLITLPHFSPGQGKCPGWWTSTWWAFIFPENFVLKIGLFDNFSIYQMITFPGIKVHKSSKTFFNDYRCCQNKNKNGNHQQCNVWDHGDPWYGFSSRFSINHQIEAHGNHQQSHSHSDPWFGFS